MPRRWLASVGSVALAMLALLFPSAAGAVPNGNGLYPHTADTCTGLTDTSMLLSAGSSIWIGDSHYLVQSFTADGTPMRTLGNMTGVASRGTTTCTGNLDGTAIVSTDLLIK